MGQVMDGNCFIESAASAPALYYSVEHIHKHARARSLLISVSMFLATLQLLKQNFYSQCFSAAGVITGLPELLYGRRFT
jgi:hypothetical protein